MYQDGFVISGGFCLVLKDDDDDDEDGYSQRYYGIFFIYFL